MNDLLKLALDAHGGLERWNQLKTITAMCSATPIPLTWTGRKCPRWCCAWKNHSKNWKKRWMIF